MELKKYKLIFYVPQNNLESVKSAVFEAGAGKLGNYSNCSWQVLGNGQFRPLEGSDPHIGSKDQLEVVSEYRVEVLCDSGNIEASVKALIDSHPYEEVAYEVIKLESL